MDSYLALEQTLLLLCADLAIIIGAARVSGWLFGKVGQPPVVGEILAGVILGPSLLGRLYPAAIATMLTPKTTSVLSAIAQIGLGAPDVPDRARVSVRAPEARGPRVDRGRGRRHRRAVRRRATLWRAGSTGSSPVAAPELAYRLFFATAVSITAIPIMGGS